MTIPQSESDNTRPVKRSRLDVETALALAGTAVSAVLLVFAAMYVGPLWRDEVNTINVAQMPSLHELWRNLSCESFPLLWPLLLRGCDLLGLAGSDSSIRVLGLYVGLFFLASLWLCARWIRCRAPILSLSLLGCLPAFIFIVGANRAYGLASGLLMVSFGMIWRVVEFPSRARVLWAGFVCLLFVQCVYYDVIFLAAMLAGGALVALRGRQWKTLVALAGIGAVSAASLVVYRPIIRKGSEHLSLGQLPSFHLSILWNRFSDAVAARSSGESGANGLEAWLWVALVVGGAAVALLMQRAQRRPAQNPVAVASTFPGRADLVLFCAVSMVIGVVGCFAFLFRLRYPTESWYYVEMLCLCAISLDGLFGANWPAARPWGLLRIGFMVLVMGWGMRSAWAEAHTRRSNVDLIAAVLNQNAGPGDLIVVQSAWVGISFDRYYHGRAPWVTVPPFDSHKVHRTDLLWEDMNQQLQGQEPMAPVLLAITNALQSSNRVWVVGQMLVVCPKPSASAGQPVQWAGTHLSYWEGQVTAQLVGHALYSRSVEIPAGQVCLLEDLPLSQFVGYRPDTK